MFERFTDRARRVVVLAQEEARYLGHNFIGTEHLTLGILREGECGAAKALESLGVSLNLFRERVEDVVGRGAGAQPGHIPFTPHGKKAMELSLRVCLRLNSGYIGTEHLLLGIVEDETSTASLILGKLGVLSQIAGVVEPLIVPRAPTEGELAVEAALDTLRDIFAASSVNVRVVNRARGRLDIVVGGETFRILTVTS